MLNRPVISLLQKQKAALVSIGPSPLLFDRKNILVENGLNNVGGKLINVPGISQGVSIFADYRKFLDRGNVIDLAVAVVIGTVFFPLLCTSEKGHGCHFTQN